MPTLAEELMGNVPIPHLGVGRPHIMRDEDESEDGGSVSDRILAWCGYIPAGITVRMVSTEFGITQGQANTCLQRLHRRGFLERGHRIKSAGQRPMQVWRYVREGHERGGV